MFSNDTNESTSLVRRCTESSGFTSEEFEGDSWKSDSDSVSDDDDEEEEEEDWLLYGENANAKEPSPAKREEDSATSQEDEDLESNDEDEDDEEDSHGTHVDDDDDDGDSLDNEEETSSRNDDGDLDSIQIDDDDDDDAGFANVSSKVAGGADAEEDRDLVKEGNDAPPPPTSAPRRPFLRRAPYSASSSLSLMERTTLSSSSVPSLEGNEGDKTRTEQLRPSNHVPTEQQQQLQQQLQQQQHSSKSTKRIESSSDDEYLETTLLPIHFDNPHRHEHHRNPPPHHHHHHHHHHKQQQQQSQRQQSPNNGTDPTASQSQSQRHHETHPTRNSTEPSPTATAAQKKTLSPPKQRRRYCLLLSLSLFCIGTAAVASWFLFYYSDHRLLASYSSSASNVRPEHDGGGETNDGIVIRPMDRPLDSEDLDQCASFTVRLVTDRYGNETFWVLSYLWEREGSVADPRSHGDGDGDDDVYYERHISDPASRKRNRLRRHPSPVQRKLSNREQTQQQPPPQPQPQPPSAPWNDLQPSQSAQELPLGNGGPYAYLDEMQYSLDSTANLHNSTFCLTRGSYKFDIYDANGDGICCRYGNGSYSLYFTGGGRVVVPSLQWKDERMATIEFDVTDEDVLFATSLSSASPSFSYVTPASTYPPSMSSFDSPTKRMATASWSDIQRNASKSYGLIFDIQTNRNTSYLVVVGMELLVYAADSIRYEVWTMPGSWRELNASDSAAFYSSFSPVANGTMLGRGVCEDCGYSSIPPEEFQDVVIEGANAVQSFWVTLASDNLVFKKRESAPIAQSRCDSFIVNVGSAVLVYPPENVDPMVDLSDNNDFLGAIQYQSTFRDIAGTSRPTPSPQISQSLNDTASPSMAAARSYSPTPDVSYEPTHDSRNPTLSNSSVPSSIPTFLNDFATTLNSSSLFPSPGPTYNETSDNWNVTSNDNATAMNFTEFINASIPDASNSSMAPTPVMFGNSISAPSSSLSPSAWPSYTDSVIADNDIDTSENSTIASGNNADKIDHTVSINASNPDIYDSSVAPTLAMIDKSTALPSSFFSSPSGPSFNDTTISHQDTISENVTSEVNNTNGTGINDPSFVYNGTDIMDFTKRSPAPSPSSNSSFVPFSSFSPSPPSSYNVTASVDNGSRNSTGKN